MKWLLILAAAWPLCVAQTAHELAEELRKPELDAAACYRVTVRGLRVSSSDASDVTLTLGSNDSATRTNRSLGGGLYNSGATLYVVVEKVCSTAIGLRVAYTVTLSL